MAGYFTISDIDPRVNLNLTTTVTLPKVFYLKSHDGYKSRVTITFWLTSGNDPEPTVSPSSVSVSLDEDETEVLAAVINGDPGDSGMVYADATDGVISDSAQLQFQIPQS